MRPDEMSTVDGRHSHRRSPQGRLEQRTIGGLRRLELLIRLVRCTLHLVLQDIGRNEHLKFADRNRELELFAHDRRYEMRRVNLEFGSLAFNKTYQFIW